MREKTYVLTLNRGLPPIQEFSSLKEAHKIQARMRIEGKLAFVFEKGEEAGKPYFLPLVLPRDVKAYAVYWASEKRSNSPEIVLDRFRKNTKKIILERATAEGHTEVRFNAIWEVTEWYLAGYTSGDQYPDMWKGYGITYMPPMVPTDLLPDLSLTPDGKPAVTVDSFLNGDLGRFRIPADRLQDFPGEILKVHSVE